MNRVMIRRCRDIPRVPTELQVVDLGLVGTATEHKWTGRVLGVYLPDADERTLFTRCRQQVTMSIQCHRRDRSLMTHDDGFSSCVRKRSHLDTSLLCMGDGEHAGVFRVERAQAIGVVARVQAVYQGEVGKVVHVGFHCEDDDHSTHF